MDECPQTVSSGEKRLNIVHFAPGTRMIATYIIMLNNIELNGDMI